MIRRNLFYLVYFMSNYWNQMGDLVHGNLRNAARSFKQESSEYIEGLTGDIIYAVKTGIIKEQMSWESELDAFWCDFDRYIDKKDSLTILDELRS